MCAQYLIKAPSHALLGIFPMSGGLENLPETLDLRVLPRGKAPVLLSRSGDLEWTMMEFSLVPSWSRDRHVKFATHNARLDSVLEKPTWKRPFLQHHCLIPLTEFIEPSYEGEWAGNMVAFSPGQVIFAAGIYDRWIDKKTGEIVESFAILTTDPVSQISSIGHDRSPLFLRPPAGQEWVEMRARTGEEQIQFLMENEGAMHYHLYADRKMRAGWELRK